MDAPEPALLGPCQGLIFDLDGTLIDSYAAITESVNAARRHFELPELSEPAIHGMVGRGLECLMVDVVGSQRVAEGVRLFRQRYAEVFDRGTVLIQGVAETIATLRDQGRPLAVASNKPARFGRPILEQLGIAEHFRVIHGPDSAGATKPDPRMLLSCAAELGHAPEDCLYVGDMVLDAESGRRAAVPTALVATGSSSEQALRSTGAPTYRDLVRLSAALPPPAATDAAPGPL